MVHRRRRRADPKNKDVETIAKVIIEKSLEAATAKTQKAEYQKIERGAKLLELVNSQKVRRAAPHCERLFEAISEKLK